MRNLLALVLALAATVGLSANDWPMWGGTPSRNMVSPMTGAPTEWDVKSGKNVKWVADLGSQSYGNPSVGGGVVILGTNNELNRDAKQAGDEGNRQESRGSRFRGAWRHYLKISRIACGTSACGLSQPASKYFSQETA